jgi:serine/threonine protein kinase
VNFTVSEFMNARNLLSYTMELWRRVSDGDAGARDAFVRRAIHVAFEIACALQHVHRNMYTPTWTSSQITYSAQHTGEAPSKGSLTATKHDLKSCQDSVCGTVGFQALDVITRKTRIDVTVSGRADEWCFGVTLFALCTGTLPRFKEKKIVNAPDWVPLPLREVILAMMSSNPRERPALNHCLRKLQPLWDQHFKNVSHPKTEGRLRPAQSSIRLFPRLNVLRSGFGESSSHGLGLVRSHSSQEAH